jgi:hypothetical protein
MIVLLAQLALAQDAPAQGTPESHPLLPVLQEQLQHNKARLTLPDAPPIYHLRYHLMELGQVDVHASLGGLVESNAGPYNLFAVEVRIGEPTYDNTGFGGWQDGFRRASLPARLTPDAVALEAWRTTDTAYKEAVEQYARKVSQFVPPPDYPGDYTLTGAVVADDGPGIPEPTVDRLQALALALTDAMREGTPLVRGEVHVGHEAGSLLTVDSEGTSVRSPVQETTVRAILSLRAPDGMLLTDERLWTVRTVDELPPLDKMLLEIQELRKGLDALAQAPTLTEEYVGPVIFEEEAAVDLFRYVLLSQLEGTPPEVPFDSMFGELGEDRDPVRLGRRVLPPGWSAVDDPMRWAAHPGSYAHDNEGTATQSVELVQDGIVRIVAMSRVPRRGVEGTNGHARGHIGQRATGRISMLEIEPDRHRSERKVDKSALKLARAYGRDWVLVVRRLQEPCVLSLDADLFWDEGIVLPPPVAIVKRWADGREEIVRGANFAGIQRWVLRDIAMAGPQQEADFFAPLSGSNWAGLSPTEGMASRIAAPEILVGEIELVPAPTDPREIPVLPPPMVAR